MVGSQSLIAASAYQASPTENNTTAKSGSSTTWLQRKVAPAHVVSQVSEKLVLISVCCCCSLSNVTLNRSLPFVKTTVLMGASATS